MTLDLVTKFESRFLERVSNDLGLSGESLCYLSAVFRLVYPCIADESDCKDEFRRLVESSGDVYGLAQHVGSLDRIFGESLVL